MDQTKSLLQESAREKISRIFLLQGYMKQAPQGPNLLKLLNKAENMVLYTTVTSGSE